jgi:hypothetical protein
MIVRIDKTFAKDMHKITDSKIRNKVSSQKRHLQVISKIIK